MTEDTVNVDGEEYIFPPDEVVKPEKQEDESLASENREDVDKENGKHQSSDKETETTQSKLQQRKEKTRKEDYENGKVIWTGGRIQ